jgi:Protein of unknown function (DUF2971)
MAHLNALPSHARQGDEDKFAFATTGASVFDFLPQKSIAQEQDAAIQAALWKLVGEVYKNIHRPPTLFHYTDAAGLKGIVESGVLRATHVAFMNDASEYLHAVSLLTQEIDQVRSSEKDQLKINLLEEIKGPVSLTRPQDVGPYFVTCLSAAENSLNQWRAYGRGEGGYSIGFDGVKLSQSMLKLNGILAPVLYDPSQQSKLVHDLLQWALSEYQKLATTIPISDRDDHRRDWAHMLLWRIGAAAPMIKNPAFVEEQEWRLIFMPSLKEQVRFVPRSTGLAPFVELKLGAQQSGAHPDRLAHLGRVALADRLPVTKLWSGPGRATDTSLLAGRTLLEQMGYDGVSLEGSKIPYRVG